MKILKLSKNEIIIILLAVGAYLGCLLNDFHTDDWIVLSLLRDGFSSRDFFSMENAGRFRPLTNILLYGRYLIFGDAAWFYYLLNVILHAFISVLFYRLLNKLGFGESKSLIAALFFAAYFQHYEAVLWLYGTIREFAVIAYILGLWCLHDYIMTESGKSYLLFAAISLTGLFIVEDFVAAPLIFGAFALLFTEKETRTRITRQVALTGLIELLIYFSIRTAVIERPGITETYYYLGWHMIRVLFEYMGWFVIPSPAHPYFQALASNLPEPVYYLWRFASYAAIFGFLPFSIWLYSKSTKQVRFFLLFVFIGTLPIIPLNYKVGPRNIYIVSLGLAVMAGYLMDKVLSFPDTKSLLRMSAVIVLTAYLGASVGAISVTSLKYRETQQLVAEIIVDMGKSEIDLNKYDFVLFDGLPGRTIVGPAMIYRLGFKKYVYASNDPVKGYINIKEKASELLEGGKTFVVFVYRDGRMVEATSEYIPPNQTDR